MILRPAQDEQGFVLMPGTAKPYPGLRSVPFLAPRYCIYSSAMANAALSCAAVALLASIPRESSRVKFT